jgi:hypothetical protein
MKSKLIILIQAVLLCFAFLNTDLIAQAKKGQFGISGSIQTIQSDISMPIWITDDLVVAPAFGLLYMSDVATDMSFGGAFRIYTAKNKFSPYLGCRIGFLILMPKVVDNVSDYIAGLFWGGEYFFNSKFSVGGELQLNASFSGRTSDRFNNPGGHNINTGTAVYATFYFN